MLRTSVMLCCHQVLLSSLFLCSLAGEDFLAAELATVQERLTAGISSFATAYEWQMTAERALILRDTMGHLEANGVRLIDARLAGIWDGSWNGLSLTTASPRLNDWLQVEDLNGMGMVADANGLSGLVQARLGRRSRGGDEMGRSENAHSMLKSGRRSVLDWNMGGRHMLTPQPASITWDLRTRPGTQVMVLRLADLLGDVRPARPPGPQDTHKVDWDEIGARKGSQRTHLDLELVRDTDGWQRGYAWAPHWNRSRHEYDASGLILESDRLHGSLLLTILPDRWVPADRRTRHLELRIAADISSGHLVGSAELHGDGVPRSLPIRGDLWHLATGSHRTEDSEGERSGPASARFRPAVRSIPAIETSTAIGRYRAMAALLHSWRNLSQTIDHNVEHVSDQQEPLTGEAAWRTHAEAYARAALVAPEAARGSSTTTDPRFGPWVGVERVPTAQLSAQPDPTVAQRWLAPTAWQALGPLVSSNRLRWRPATLPEVLPAEGTSYADVRIRYAAEERITLAWTAVAGQPLAPPTDAWDAIWVHSGKMSSYSTHPLEKAWRASESANRGFHWYATTAIDAAAAIDTWVAVRCIDHGCLWLNGHLVWESGNDADPWKPAIVPVRLQAGRNEVLIRATQESIGYHPPPEALRSCIGFWVAVAGAPRTTAAVAVETAQTASLSLWGRAQPSERSRDATPPLAWDLKSGLNMGWERSEPSPVGPVLAGADLVVVGSGTQLQALDRTTGTVRWSADLGQGSLVPDPVATSDGIYAVSSAGLAMAWTQDGRERWKTDLGVQWNPAPQQSLLAVDDLLLIPVHLPRQNQGTAKGIPWFLIALDRHTGRERWRSEPIADDLPAALTALAVQRGERRKVLLASSSGLLLDASDGRLLASGLTRFDTDPAVAPWAHGSSLWLASTAGQCRLDFWLDEEGRLAWHRRWDSSRSGNGGSSGLVHDGVFYVARIADEFHPHHVVPWVQLDYYEATSGDHLGKIKPSLRDALDPLPPVRAGEMIIAAASGAPGMGIKTPEAQLLFLRAGDRPLRLTSRSLGPRRLLRPPLADGPDLLLSCADGLLCLRRDPAPSARRQEAILLADELITELGRPPQPPALTTPAPWTGTLPPTVPIGTVAHNQTPTGWIMAGPLPQGAEDVVTGHGDLTQPLLPGNKLQAQGQTVAAALLPPAAMPNQGSAVIGLGDQAFYAPRRVIDLLEAFQRTPRSQGLFSTILRCTEERVLAVDCGGLVKAQAWLAGEPLVHGQVLRLRPGDYVLLLRLEIGSIPPVGRPVANLCFLEQPLPEEAYADWLQRVRERQDRLTAILAELPDTPQAILARELLDRLTRQ